MVLNFSHCHHLINSCNNDALIMFTDGRGALQKNSLVRDCFLRPLKGSARILSHSNDRQERIRDTEQADL